MMSELDSPPPLARRIVTGHDESAKSVVLYDDTKGNREQFPNGSTVQTLWFTDNVPADCSAGTNADPTGNKTFRVCNEGSVCMVYSGAPGTSAPMHRTQSLDYGVVLEGEIELELDNGHKRLLKAGDVIVQRETTHAWHNRHPTKWVKVFWVIVAAQSSDEGAQTRDIVHATLT